jgi:hypothetical protein
MYEHPLFPSNPAVPSIKKSELTIILSRYMYSYINTFINYTSGHIAHQSPQKFPHSISTRFSDVVPKNNLN